MTPTPRNPYPKFCRTVLVRRILIVILVPIELPINFIIGGYEKVTTDYLRGLKSIWNDKNNYTN